MYLKLLETALQINLGIHMGYQGLPSWTINSVSDSPAHLLAPVTYDDLFPETAFLMCTKKDFHKSGYSFYKDAIKYRGHS